VAWLLLGLGGFVGRLLDGPALLDERRRNHEMISNVNARSMRLVTFSSEIGCDWRGRRKVLATEGNWLVLLACRLMAICLPAAGGADRGAKDAA